MLSKICNKLEIGREKFIDNLKSFAYQNMINVTIDEVDDVVEVFEEEDFDTRKTLDDLKGVYRNVSF